MKIRIAIISIIIFAALLGLAACAPSNPYGRGHGDIAVIGARSIRDDFWRTSKLNDIDNLKVWHQQSDRGEWIEFTIVWIGEFSGLEEFAQKVICFDCVDSEAERWKTGCVCIIELYTADFFAGAVI